MVAELEPSSAVVVEPRSFQREDEGEDEDVDATWKVLFRKSFGTSSIGPTILSVGEANDCCKDQDRR